MNDRPRIIFFGTSEFAIPVFDMLVKSGYDIFAVVTVPDEPVGRKLVLTPPPLKRHIMENDISVEIFQPEKLSLVYDTLADLKPDLFIIAAYGKIIPKDMLALSRKGSLNVHPSLLPRWRGPSPIQYALLSGDKETGVTIMQVDELMDHGPIIAIRTFSLEREKLTYLELHDILAEEGADLLRDVLPRWLRGEVEGAPQDDAQATFSKLLTKDDGRIDWSRSAVEIEQKIRAFSPWPGAWTLWPSEDRFFRLRIEEADVLAETARQGSPGYVYSDEDTVFAVKTGKGCLAVKRLTIEGKKSSSADEFMRGHTEIKNQTLV